MIHHISFKHAFDGIKYVFSTQPNMRFHGLATALAVGLGIGIGITRDEWLIILFTIVLVWVAEMVNTAIESMTDLITQEYKKQAKVAKDVSAGMVLVAAIASVIVGLAVFVPYFV